MQKLVLFLVIISVVLIGLGSGCGNTKDEKSTWEETAINQMPLLQEALDARKAEFEQEAPAELKALLSASIDSVAQSGVLETALRESDTAPDFALPNANGEIVALSQLLEDGPVVLSWYRGGWCPYCNIQLNAYNDILDEIIAAGGQLVAITPEIPDSSLSTVEKNNLKFEVLSDLGNKVAEQFRIAYTLSTEIIPIYREHIGLAAFNNDNSNILPLAATYIIDSDQIITYAFIEADYKKRAEPADIIKVLKMMQSAK